MGVGIYMSPRKVPMYLSDTCLTCAIVRHSSLRIITTWAINKVRLRPNYLSFLITRSGVRNSYLLAVIIRFKSNYASIVNADFAIQISSEAKRYHSPYISLACECSRDGKSPVLRKWNWLSQNELKLRRGSIYWSVLSCELFAKFIPIAYLLSLNWPPIRWTVTLLLVGDVA